MRAKRLDTAERFAQRKNFKTFHDFDGFRQRVAVEFERHHPAKTAHLFLRQFVLRMGFQPRIIHLTHFRMLAQKPGNLQRVFTMPLHPDVQRFDPAKHQKGLVQHSFGWPLDNATGGGSFLYHYDDNLVAVGFVLHLNYENPYIYPFEEFQRFKTHPKIRDTFAGAKRLAYGSRAITEGGYQSVPRLTFPGGALIGCAAGFVNVPRIKGVHNAMASALQAAGHINAALAAGRANDELVEYENGWRSSSIGKDLYPVRNAKPLWSKFGTVVGNALGGLDMWCNTLGFSLFGTQSHAKPDRKTLKPAKDYQPIAYPKPDGKLTFDRLSSLFLSNVNHEEDQPVHLKVADMELQKSSEHDVFAGPSNRYCPAGVYEWVEESTGPRFQINAQNCVHCKTCDVKDPNGNITWVPPEGGGGPNYEAM